MDHAALKESFQAVWQNRKSRYSILLCLCALVAFVVLNYVWSGPQISYTSSQNTIVPAFVPKDTTQILDNAKTERLIDAFKNIDGLKRTPGGVQNEQQFSHVMQELEIVRQRQDETDQELELWRSGEMTKRLEATRYKTDAIDLSGEGQTYGNNEQSGLTANLEQMEQQMVSGGGADQVVGIRSMNSNQDFIMLSDGSVKTLIEAGQLQNQGASGLSEQEKKDIERDLREKELLAKIEMLKNAEQAPDSYSIKLPTTSLITATLITGMQAPTSIGSKREPLPAVIRIKKDSLLPNNYRADIRDCQGMVSAIGSLQDSRAYMRLENITCMDEDGRTAESEARGFATGQDGQAGIPGRLVARNGEVLKGSMWAGFFSGLAEGIAPQRVGGIDIASDGEGGGFVTPDLGAIGTASVLNGGATSLDRISEYYVKMLEEIWPTVDVPPLQEVNFHLQSPLVLTFTE
ncbi:TraB/VirB10 family protein [Enterovibrio norvegicus]|uniref:TraB/VirB10 family protein n=1 Tax=Enterovibrio norvegicus TaxID=188144 RepID=UPI00352ED0F0